MSYRYKVVKMKLGERLKVDACPQNNLAAAESLCAVFNRDCQDHLPGGWDRAGRVIDFSYYIVVDDKPAYNEYGEISP